mmetsp:Transcript_17532/g.57411  ORF Transcript_17532/g.57411 Transcript_17532/m.57411 type:complete len:202 (-) Transcript_17532:371-976(-)
MYLQPGHRKGERWGSQVQGWEPGANTPPRLQGITATRGQLRMVACSSRQAQAPRRVSPTLARRRGIHRVHGSCHFPGTTLCEHTMPTQRRRAARASAEPGQLKPGLLRLPPVPGFTRAQAHSQAAPTAERQARRPSRACPPDPTAGADRLRLTPRQWTHGRDTPRAGRSSCLSGPDQPRGTWCRRCARARVTGKSRCSRRR